MRKILFVALLAFSATGCAAMAQSGHHQENHTAPATSAQPKTSANRSWSGYGVTFEYANPEEAFIDGERATVVEREATARVYQVGDKTVIYYMPEKKAYYKQGTTLVGYLK